MIRMVFGGNDCADAPPVIGKTLSNARKNATTSEAVDLDVGFGNDTDLSAIEVIQDLSIVGSYIMKRFLENGMGVYRW
jgi:hypothetical protein